jgi:hypothetical protein
MNLQILNEILNPAVSVIFSWADSNKLRFFMTSATPQGKRQTDDFLKVLALKIHEDDSKDHK